LNKNTLDDLATKLADAVPNDIGNLRDDLKKNFRGLLSGGLDKLELVTREEFEIQRKVLERSREKLDQLERQLQKLQGQDLQNQEPQAEE
jgi:BMFP domain-containing protein YqiC